jgi:hypothetical protein
MINLRRKNPERSLPLSVLAVSNSGRALALRAIGAAVLGTSALYGRQLDGRQ